MHGRCCQVSPLDGKPESSRAAVDPETATSNGFAPEVRHKYQLAIILMLALHDGRLRRRIRANGGHGRHRRGPSRVRSAGLICTCHGFASPPACSDPDQKCRERRRQKGEDDPDGTAHQLLPGTRDRAHPGDQLVEPEPLGSHLGQFDGRPVILKP
jgi:hypothetical protein